MSDLPEGWRRVKLKDCGTWWSGGTPATEEPRFWGGDIPWISAASLKDFNIVDSDRRVTHAGSMAGTRVVNEGTVLFVVRGMSLKSEFRVGVARRRVAFGQDCKAIMPSRRIDGAFLALALKVRERSILGMVDEAGHGTGRLPTDLLAKLDLPIPEDLSEQRRIAEIIDALDEEKRTHDDVKLKHRNLRQAVIGDLMAGESFEAPAEYVRCSRIFSLTGGLPRQQAQMSAAGTIPIYGSSGLAGFGQKALSMGEALIIGRVGEGGVGSVRYSSGPCWVTDNALWSTWISPDWLAEFLAMYLDWYDLRKLRSQTGQPLITQSAIGKVPVPVIPLQKQEEVVAVARALKDQHGISNARLAKSDLVRQGVTEDLLTGRVRV